MATAADYINTWPEVSHDLWKLLYCLIGLAVLDITITRRLKGRWFILHAIANGFIAWMAAPDAWYSFANTLEACRGPYNKWSMCMIGAIHLYHLVAFSNVSVSEWAHHLVFVPAIVGLGLVYKSGPLVNLLAIFICGIPGGLDYVMLAMVKNNLMSPLSEKKWNARVMVWMRSPGLIICAMSVYVAGMWGPESSCVFFPIQGFIVAGLIFVNGQYYMQVVVGNTFRKDSEYSC